MAYFTSFLLLIAWSLHMDQPVARLDAVGDPLPEHAIARMGTLRLRHGDSVCGACFSHDEKSLYTAGSDNAVRQWDVVTGKLLRELSGHDLCFTALAISPDGKTLAAAGGSADCRVYLWDALSGKQLDEIKGEMDINALVFLPDSETLAWITLEHRLVLWNVAAKTRKVVRIATNRATHGIAVSPDGKQIAVGDDGGVVRLIDPASGQITRQWKNAGDDPSIDCICYSHDGTMLATAGGLYTPIQLWDAKTGNALQVLKLEWQLERSIAFSPDDKTILSQHHNDLILWDVATGRQRQTIALPQRDYANGFAFSRDGKMLAIAHDGHAISLIDLEAGKLLFPLQAHRGVVKSVVWLDSERKVASASLDGTIRLWNAETGAQERVISCGETWPSCMVSARDGQSVCWGAYHSTVHVLNVMSGKEAQVLKGHELTVRSLDLSPDGRRLVSAAGSVLKLWDLASGNCLVTQEYDDHIEALAFLPDGKQFVSARGNRLYLCEADTLKVLAAWDGHTDTVASLSLSPDGKRLASRAYGVDDTVRVWNVATRQQIATIDVQGGVGALAIAPDGNLLAFTHFFDPTITIWDISAGKAVRVLKGHVRHIYSLRFSSDGSRLISTGGDTTLIVWDVALCANNT